MDDVPHGAGEEGAGQVHHVPRLPQGEREYAPGNVIVRHFREPVTNEFLCEKERKEICRILGDGGVCGGGVVGLAEGQAFYVPRTP